MRVRVLVCFLSANQLQDFDGFMLLVFERLKDQRGVCWCPVGAAGLVEVLGASFAGFSAGASSWIEGRQLERVSALLEDFAQQHCELLFYYAIAVKSLVIHNLLRQFDQEYTLIFLALQALVNQARARLEFEDFERPSDRPFDDRLILQVPIFQAVWHFNVT